MKVHIPMPARAGSARAGAVLFLVAAACSLSPVADGGAQEPESEPDAPSLQVADEADLDGIDVTGEADPNVQGTDRAGPNVQSAEDIASDQPPLAGPVPKLEPMATQANRPYQLRGRTYRPMTALGSFRQRGTASWYGKSFQGRRTATGERFEMDAMSAAHPTLPLPSYVKVTNLRNGTSVVVRVNDRGPFAHNRVIDVSHAAARHLGILHTGTAAVEVDLIVPEPAADTQGPAPETAESGPGTAAAPDTAAVPDAPAPEPASD